MEVLAPCMQIAHYAKRGADYLQTTRRRPTGLMRFTKKLTLVYQPLGVVGLITPWNGPIALAANPLAQALMAGNAVVHKPSEVTPFSAVLLKELTDAAGFPDDLYQVIQGDGETGAALIEAGVDKISFTGSVATGRKVGEACGRNLIPVTLELGGKDAMIVCRDADLDRAADGAVRGSFFNTGHYCCGTERVYVPESIYDAFVEKVVEQTRSLKQTDRGEGDVGAVFWDRQMDIIESHMADAKARGARVLVGGERDRRLSGFFFPPTVVVDVDHGMDLMRQETFGPIVAIQKVRDEEEALELANDSDYGLSGNVWTTDLAKGEALAERLRTGSVSVNDISVTYGIPEAPFGGLKASGVGQVNGEIGIRGFCHLHPIIIDTSRKARGGYPYTSGERGRSARNSSASRSATAGFGNFSSRASNRRVPWQSLLESGTKSAPPTQSGVAGSNPFGFRDPRVGNDRLAFGTRAQTRVPTPKDRSRRLKERLVLPIRFGTAFV